MSIETPQILPPPESSAQLPPPPEEASPTPPGGESGHSVAQWDIYQPLNLTDIQLRAIELTVQGLTDARVAEILSIDRKTLWRWKTFDDEYRQVLTDTRVQVFAAATDRYQHLLLRATAVLAKFLDAPEENHRFRAAQALLNMAGAFRPIYFRSNQSLTPSIPPEPPLPPQQG